MKQKESGANVVTAHGLRVLVLAVGLALLNITLCLGATVTFSNNVAAAQSTTDAITGMYPFRDLGQYDYYSSLTDAPLGTVLTIR